MLKVRIYLVVSNILRTFALRNLQWCRQQLKNNSIMFVRFTKRNGNPNRVYRRAVAINGTYLVQEGNNIVAYAYLSNKTNLQMGTAKCPVYRCVIIGDGDKCADVERYIKRFIGNSAKWENETYKKRVYDCVCVTQDSLNKTDFQIVGEV